MIFKKRKRKNQQIKNKTKKNSNLFIKFFYKVISIFKKTYCDYFTKERK